MINANCCELLRRSIQDDAFPLKYDSHVEEVQIELSYPQGEGSAVVRYCPFCGKKLESGRSDLFTKPTEEDQLDLKTRLRAISSLEEVVNVLGLPDDEGTGCGSSNDPWKRWYRYSRVWNSLELTIGETINGNLNWAICGQYQPPSIKDDDPTA
jgi:hypothetical protein